MRCDIRLIAVGLLFIPGVACSDAPTHVIRLVGYNDMHDMLATAAAAIEQAHPGVEIALDLRSTRSAPPALIDGSAALAPMGAPMDPADRAAIRVRWGADPIEIRIAHDSLSPKALSSPTAVLVARDNPLRSITLSAVRAAFAGTAPLHWGDLGARGEWSGKPVHLYGLASDTAIGRYLLDGPLAKAAFATSYRAFHQSRDVAAAVAADRYGIGLANLNHAMGGTRALVLIDAAGHRHVPDRAEIVSGRYPFDRFLLVYARREPDGAIEPYARLILDFLLSSAGQSIISHGKLGYLPLNDTERIAERHKIKK